MSKPANIYAASIDDMHPKVATYIHELDSTGQIDHDEYGHPYVVDIKAQGQLRIVRIVRNGEVTNFFLNTRKRKIEPRVFWNKDDGYRRRDEGPKGIVTSDGANVKKQERGLRSMSESQEIYYNLVESILKGAK